MFYPPLTKSFGIWAVPFWNKLPDDIVSVSSMKPFKTLLDANWQSLLPEVEYNPPLLQPIPSAHIDPLKKLTPTWPFPHTTSLGRLKWSLLLTQVAQAALLVWVTISPCFVSIHLKRAVINLTVILIYIPTPYAEEEAKASFWDNLQDAIDSTPSVGMLIVVVTGLQYSVRQTWVTSLWVGGVLMATFLWIFVSSNRLVVYSTRSFVVVLVVVRTLLYLRTKAARDSNRGAKLGMARMNIVVLSPVVALVPE